MGVRTYRNIGQNQKANLVIAKEQVRVVLIRSLCSSITFFISHFRNNTVHRLPQIFSAFASTDSEYRLLYPRYTFVLFGRVSPDRQWGRKLAKAAVFPVEWPAGQTIGIPCESFCALLSLYFFSRRCFIFVDIFASLLLSSKVEHCVMEITVSSFPYVGGKTHGRLWWLISSRSSIFARSKVGFFLGVFFSRCTSHRKVWRLSGTRKGQHPH